MERHCNTCEYSYQAISFSNKPLGQNCNNVYYNDSEYTSQMLLDDIQKYDAGCRFYKCKEDTVWVIQGVPFFGYVASRELLVIARTDTEVELAFGSTVVRVPKENCYSTKEECIEAIARLKSEVKERYGRSDDSGKASN